jgi:hypothetical protein
LNGAPGGVYGLVEFRGHGLNTRIALGGYHAARHFTLLFAIAMSAALIGGAATTSQAASRAGQQCGNFFECLFGGINNGNSGDRSRGFYQPQERR